MNARHSSLGIFGRESLPTLMIPFALGVILVWQNNLHHRPDSGIFFTAFLGFFWCLIFTVLAAKDRCSELELALPYSGIQIWKNHVFSTLARTMAHVAVFLLPITLAGNPYFIRQFLVTGGFVLTGLIFTGALIHRIEPGCNRVRNSGQLNGAVGAGLIVTVLLLIFRSPWLPLITIAAAGLLMLAAARNVRESLTLVDDRSKQTEGYASLGRWDAAGGESSRSIPNILRGPARTGSYFSSLWMIGIMNLRQYSLLARIFCFLTLISIGGELVSPAAGLGTVIISVLATLICLNVLSSEMNRSRSPYAHLPLPRRQLHAGLLLPVVISIAFGAVVQGSIFLAFHSTPPNLVRTNEWENGTEKGYIVQVPSRYHRIAWDGQPPAVTGSNGETYMPAITQKLSYDNQGGPVVYNPFEVGSRSSRTFAVEQYTRAVKAVYGIDLDQQKAERLMSRGDWRLDSVEGLTMKGGPQLTAIGIMIFCVVWTLLTAGNALISRLVSPARFAQWRSRPQALVLPGLAIIFSATFIAMKTSAMFFFWLAQISSVLTFQLAQLMPGAFLSLTLALTCLAGAFLLSQELFVRREVLPGGQINNA